jgi:PPOX class probable F420-dependent enzyme
LVSLSGSQTMWLTPFFFISASTVSGLSASAIMFLRRRGGAWYDPGKPVGNRAAIPQNRAMISDSQRRFVNTRRVGHLATADAAGVPHLIPVCFALDGGALYITVDEKPKRQDIPLKRVRNILENPHVAFVVDRWDEDWTRLGWVMLRGRAEILEGGDEHDRAQALLRDKYPQYRAMSLDGLPVIALRVARASGWGDLSAD